MLRRVWKPVAATVVIGTPAYYYYKAHYNAPQTFDLQVKVKGPTGKTEMSTRTFPLLPLKDLGSPYSSERDIRDDDAARRYYMEIHYCKSRFQQYHRRRVPPVTSSDATSQTLRLLATISSLP